MLLFSCSNKDLDGLWFGQFENYTGRDPVLIKFENNDYIEYFSIDSDTLKYKYFRNKIYLTNRHNEKNQFKISLENNELSLFDSKSDTLIVKLKKIKESNFVFDFLNDKSLKIELPSGKGLERTFGYSHRFNNPLYLSYKNNKLVANFFDTSISVDSNYYKFLIKKINYTGREMFEWEKNNVSLIADKNITGSDLDLIKKQLSIAGYSSVDYFLKSNSYDKINFFSLRLLDLSAEEKDKFNIKKDSFNIPLPSRIDGAIALKERMLLVEINKGIIKINNKSITNDQFKNIIDSRIKSDTVVGVFYHLNNGSVYQDFININDKVINSIYNARDNYLNEKYGIKFREYHRFKNEEIRSSKIKIPLIIGQLNSDEYEKIKNSL